MKQKETLVQKFMKLTGKTSFFLGPANRSAMEHHGKHRKPSAEEVEATERAEKTWEVVTTESGRHYLIERNQNPASESKLP